MLVDTFHNDEDAHDYRRPPLRPTLSLSSSAVAPASCEEAAWHGAAQSNSELPEARAHGPHDYPIPAE